jgi:glycosyltransferase involved in cell wall biosynthesis
VLNTETMSTSSTLLDLPPAAPSVAKPPTRRALLFFLSGQESYRHPLFSKNEIFCGPDATPRLANGRVQALKTTGGSFDVRETLRRLPGDQQPDFIVVKADATGRNFPRNLAAVSGPKVLLVGDTHHMSQPLQSLIRYAREEPFDYVIFDHTRHHARFFAEAGLRNLHWLPALDYGFEPRELRSAPSRPLTFVGQTGRFHPYRRWVLQQVQAAQLPLQTLRGPLAETANIYADSQITLNISLNGDLNLRVFEALAAGGFLLTDELGEDSGLSRLFEAGRHLDTWRTPGELVEKIRHYLAHPDEARQIRRQGQAELLRAHHPDVKLREFYGLIDGGAPNPRYDLRLESWWPRSTVVAPGLPRRLAAYEALQEMHRTACRVTVFAADPAEAASLGRLPRLNFAPLAAMALDAAPGAREGSPPARSVLWWEEATPAEELAKFPGDALLALTAAAAARPEVAAWGFAPESDASPVLRLTQSLLFLEQAWKADAREAVRSRLQPLIDGSRSSDECLVLANYAWQLGDPRMQLAALKRAIGLDRNNADALLALAAMMLDQGDTASVSVLLEEAARIAPLAPELEALRLDLGARPEVASGLNFYLRAIGRVPEPKAGRPRRILLVTNIFPPQELGGYGRMMWEFAHGLRARGHEVRVLTSDQAALAKAPTPDEAEMETCVRRTLPLLGEYRNGLPVGITDRAELNQRVRGIISVVDAAGREFHPDVVLAGNLDFLDFAPIQVALAAGVPVLHALGNQSPGYGTASQPRSARYWVGPSSDWNGEILQQKGFAPARISTLYPGARIDRFFRFFLPDTARLRICFAGLVMPFKGAHVLVDALERLHRSGVDFTAEIAGDAPDAEFLERLRAAVRAVGMEHKVSFTGFLDRSDLAALFARSNVLVFPSQVPETFGISQVEAMAAGLVVISSGTGGAQEVIRHDQDGLLFAAPKADELAQQIFSLVQDPARMQRLQRAAQARAVTFSVDHSVRKIEELVEELIQVPPDAPAAGTTAPLSGHAATSG